eukprot:scaffold128_cov328-Pavlova_lutheri.AAC.22
MADVFENKAFFARLHSLSAVRAPKVEGLVQQRHRSVVFPLDDPGGGFFHVGLFHGLPLSSFPHETQDRLFEFLPTAPCAFQGRLYRLGTGFASVRRRAQQQGRDGRGRTPLLSLQELLQKSQERRHVSVATLRSARHVHASHRVRGSGRHALRSTSFLSTRAFLRPSQVPLPPPARPCGPFLRRGSVGRREAHVKRA